jgi:hypothetical protein
MAVGRKFGFENVGKTKTDLIIVEKNLNNTS